VKVFLSHASEQGDIARSIEIALRGEGHSVFLDRSSLPAGETYDDQIREAIVQCDLFVFLISPEAVARGRYTLTELELAEHKWPHPSGGVLPVLVSATELASVPAYLKGVTILEPQGNIAAAVAMATARIGRPWYRRLARRWGAVLVVLGLLAGGAGVWWGYHAWTSSREIAALLEAGRLQHDSGNYTAAWDVYARAATLAPRRRDVVLAQERLAMDWLDDIRVTVGKETFTSIVEKVQPALSRCAVSNEARRAADCIAHIGWSDFLRSREGVGGLDPTQHYRRALDRDPENVYAHTMSGFEILRTAGSLLDARAHFTRALATKREPDYVRHLQIGALLWRGTPETELEVVRVANEMRESGQAMTSRRLRSDASRLWSVYSSHLVNRRDAEPFLSAVSPAQHLATFRWLFPEAEVPSSRRNLYLFMLGTFQERAGERADALATYRTLHEALTREGAYRFGGPLPDRTRAAMERLAR
jgi:tetratricopeptide (TPR) repeat protein